MVDSELEWGHRGTVSLRKNLLAERFRSSILVFVGGVITSLKRMAEFRRCTKFEFPAPLSDLASGSAFYFACFAGIQLIHR